MIVERIAGMMNMMRQLASAVTYGVISVASSEQMGPPQLATKELRPSQVPRVWLGTYSVKLAKSVMRSAPMPKPMIVRTTIKKVMLGEAAATYMAARWIPT